MLWKPFRRGLARSAGLTIHVSFLASSESTSILHTPISGWCAWKVLRDLGSRKEISLTITRPENSTQGGHVG